MMSILKTKQENLGDYNNCPVVIFMQGGELLKSSAIHEKQGFVTTSYLVTKINDNGCMTLELLKPCKKCCGQCLIPSEKCITIDIDCICGVQFISYIPIRDSNHDPVCHKDCPCCEECDCCSLCSKECICGPFAIPSGYQETVLWTTNLKADLNVFLTVCVEEGSSECLELKVYKQSQKEIEIYSLSEMDYKISLDDCKMITLCKADVDTEVKGIFEIEVTSNMNTPTT